MQCPKCFCPAISISCPAFSCPAILIVCHFLHVYHFQSTHPGTSTPLKHRRSLRPWKNEGERKSCIFSWKMGGRKIKGGRKTKLLKHIFALCSSYFLKNFLARYARSIAFFSSLNQGMRNIYGRDGKVRLTFTSGTEKRRFSVLHFWWPNVTKLITKSKLNIELYTFSCTGCQSCQEQDN